MGSCPSAFFVRLLPQRSHIDSHEAHATIEHMLDYHYIPVRGRQTMKTYVFTISLEPDEDGWRAFYAPLEHICASTWGASQEEAVKHIHEVLSMIIDELLEAGKDVAASDGLMVTEGAAVAIAR